MKNPFPIRRLGWVLVLGGFAACQTTPAEQTPATNAAPAAPADAYVVEVVAEDYAFEAPNEILSGWTTFRMTNEGEETHFLYLTRIPDDRTYDDYLQGISRPVNDAWQAVRAGEIDKAGAFEQLGAEIPGWYWMEAEAFGGPGLVAAGGASQATVELEPGTYVLECFMKTAEGEFHWVEGMIRPIEVLAERSDAPEPTADVDITLTTDAITTRGEPQRGSNTVALHFAEQPEVGFGNDVHVVRLDDGMAPQTLVSWMDAFNLEGLVNPAPATFVGGSHERPEGRMIYFTVDLDPGRYAWMAEAPDHAPLFREFTVR